MSNRKRFHPLAILAYLITSFKRFMFLIFLALLNIGEDKVFSLIMISGIFVLCLIVALYKYFTHTYDINQDKILMYNGIFIKKEREIPYERIQTIKQRQWFFYKPFNLVQILIETGSTSDQEAEASLICVDASHIDLIEEHRQGRHEKKRVEGNVSENTISNNTNDLADSLDYDASGVIENKTKEKEVDSDNEIIYQYKMSYKDILLYALTDLEAFLILIPIIIFVWEIISEFDIILNLIPNSVFEGFDVLMAQALWIIVTFFLVSGLVLVLIISLIKNFLYYFEFTVTCTRKTITIEYGMFERKTQKIPLNKVQGIKIYQQVLRRVLHMSSVEVIIIGGQETVGESELENKLLLLPLISSRVLYEALIMIFPGYVTREPDTKLVGKGKLFYFWRWVLLFGVLLVPVGFYFFTWLGFILAVITVLLLFLQWLDYRHQGYSIISKNYIMIQNFLGFSKVQTFLNHSKIQAFDKNSSWLLLNKNIGHVNFHIKSGISDMSVGLRFVDGNHINEIQRFFNRVQY